MTEVSAEAVEALLRTHLDPAAECRSVTRGPAGNGQETWFVEAVVDGRDHPLVLRRSAADGTMNYTDRAQEFATLRRVFDAGLPVPRVHWMEAEASGLERPYFVMDRLPGGPPGREDEAGRACIARQLGARLAELHALGPAPVSAAEATAAEVRAWSRRAAEGLSAPSALLSALLAWLEANQPRLEGPAVRCWGDPGPHNILVEEGRVTALLDWEMTHDGHPLDDLGVAIWSCLGVLDPEQVVAGYERAAGAPVDRDLLDYFEVLASVARSISIATGVAAYRAGAIEAPAVAGLGLELFTASLLRGAAAAGWPPAAAPDLAPGREPAEGLVPTPAEAARGVARLLTGEVLVGTADARLDRKSVV